MDYETQQGFESGLQVGEHSARCGVWDYGEDGGVAEGLGRLATTDLTPKTVVSAASSVTCVLVSWRFDSHQSSEKSLREELGEALGDFLAGVICSILLR